MFLNRFFGSINPIKFLSTQMNNRFNQYNLFMKSIKIQKSSFFSLFKTHKKRCFFASKKANYNLQKRIHDYKIYLFRQK